MVMQFKQMAQGGYKLSVSGGVQPVSIDHSDNGIRKNHMGVEIESISIDNTDFGIWVQGNEYGLSSLIAHSNLNCNIHGIELWMNIGSTSQKNYRKYYQCWKSWIQPFRECYSN